MRNLLYFFIAIFPDNLNLAVNITIPRMVRLCSVLATELRFERIIMAAIMYTEGSCTLMPSVQNVSIF